ncbi:MAG: iron-sulfur cluster co-chaperone HscB C-terminal domain-containing protein [Sediminibacterium sp.]|jgi:molecular chaperone HscB
MNYFELFGLPIGFQVDTNKLRAAFMDIQRASHPDKFAQSNSYEQDEALERSALANKGFSLLNNKDQIMPYVLELKGIIDADEKYALSPDFLMEMMELNEAWMEADDESAKQSILSQIKAIQDEILEPIKGYLEMDQIDSISQEAMLQIKEYYYKKKYLDRILAEFR